MFRLEPRSNSKLYALEKYFCDVKIFMAAINIYNIDNRKTKGMAYQQQEDYIYNYKMPVVKKQVHDRHYARYCDRILRRLDVWTKYWFKLVRADLNWD